MASNPMKPVPLTQTDLNEIKHSRKRAEDFFKKRRIHGWPRVMTTEPGKHFLVV